MWGAPHSIPHDFMVGHGEGDLDDTPATRYRFLVIEIENRESKIWELRHEADKLEERLNQLKSWRDEMKTLICPHCNGAGQINEWRDQDDCKTVTCTCCKGSGLKV